MIINFQPDSRIFHMEIFQLIQKKYVKGSLAGSNRNASMGKSTAVCQFLFCRPEMRHGCRHMGIQFLPFRCQLYPTVRPDKKRTVKLLLQSVHCPCDIRLTVAKGIGSPGKITVFCHIIKNLIIFKIYIHTFSPYQFIISAISIIAFTYSQCNSIIKPKLRETTPLHFSTQTLQGAATGSSLRML